MKSKKSQSRANKMIAMIYWTQHRERADLCRMCRDRAGNTDWESYIGVDLTPDNDEAWNNIAKQQAKGRFTRREVGVICDACLSNVLLHCDKEAGAFLAIIFSIAYTPMTIAMVGDVVTNNPSFLVKHGHATPKALMTELLSGDTFHIGMKG